ncbi:MAG: hypothetical protein RJB38_1189 [Pseudomonadota bacterium]|jgi:hypothetical protein
MGFVSCFLLVEALSPRAWGFSSPRPRLDLVMATTERPSHPDSRGYEDSANRALLSWTHDTLYEWTHLDTTPKLRAVLAAERASFDTARKVVTIRLKSGLTFSSGEPLEASHFIQAWRSLEKLPEHSIARRSFLSRMSSYRAINPQTIQIQLREPDPQFEMRLALAFTAPVLQSAIPDSSPTAPAFSGTASPLPGSGPFILSAWHPGYGLILNARRGYNHSFFPDEASPEYRITGELQHSSKALPQLDGIRVDWVKTEDEAWKAFRTGKSDLLELHENSPQEIFSGPSKRDLAPQWVKQGITIEKGWRPSVSLALLNLKTLPARDQRREILAQLGRQFWREIPGFREEALGPVSLSEFPLVSQWVEVAKPVSTSAPLSSMASRPGPRRVAQKSAAARPLRLTVIGEGATAQKLLDLATERLEAIGYAPEGQNLEIGPAIQAFRDGQTDLLFLGWTWETPTWASVLEPLFYLEPQSPPESSRLLQVLKKQAAAEFVDLEALHSTLEQLAVWSPGPRHERRVLVQPWIRGFHVSPATERPEKYLRLDHELRVRALGN